MLASIRGRLRIFVLWLIVTVFLLLLLASAPQTKQYFHKPGAGPPFDSEQPPDSEILIPKLIWQIFFPPPGATVLDSGLVHSNTWIEMAPGYTYTLVGNLEAESFLAAHFSDRPEIISTFHALKNPASKSDFLRYLLLYIRGGIYSDVDTKPVVRLDAWLAPQRRRDVELLLAAEHDEPIDHQTKDYTYPVQFCQWTMAAAPNHTVFAKMIDRMLTSLQDVADRQGTTLDKVELKNFDVVNTTGPVAWTEVIFEHLQSINENIKRYEDIWNIEEPKYYGKVAVLPVESFRAERLADWGFNWEKSKYALVRHFFKGGWKKPSLP